MEKPYKTILEPAEDEFVEKKSRFIAYTSPVHTVEEANAFIAGIRQRHWDATHNVPAFVLRSGVQRSSDDGEPGGTAGMPVLDVLLKSGVQDVCVVVTRYFGGTLLGTGGLVRAYSGAAKEGLLASTIITRKYASKLEIRTEYTGFGKIQYILAQQGIHILDIQYTDQVRIVCLVPDVEKGKIEKELTEGTNGQAGLGWKEKCYFAVHEGKILLFNK
jgi:uncharacterized YigZ family protein